MLVIIKIVAEGPGCFEDTSISHERGIAQVQQESSIAQLDLALILSA